LSKTDACTLGAALTQEADWAGDGNRTHVSCPSPPAKSITYRRWRPCVWLTC